MSIEQNNGDPDGARPQVEGPNPFPTGSRVETASENYAAGAPSTTVLTETVKRARAAMLERTVEKKPGDMVTTYIAEGSAHIALRTADGSIERHSIYVGPLRSDVGE